MAKPIVDTTWCTSGTNTTAPTEDQRLNGWDPNELPTSDVLNYFQNAVGLITEYLEEQSLEAPLTVQAASESTYTPLISGLDPSNQTRRANVDHNGFRMGRVSDFREEWFTTTQVDPVGWTFDGSAGGARNYTDPSEQNGYRMARLDVGPGNNSSSKVYSVPITYFSAGRTFVFEWDVTTGNAISGQGAIDYKGLVEFSHADAWDHYIGFMLTPAVNANVGYVLEGNASVPLYTDVEIATSTTYRFRVELCGENNHNGNNILARWFLNGTFINQAMFGSPGYDLIRVSHSLANGPDNPNAEYRVLVGPNRASWNHDSNNDAI